MHGSINYKRLFSYEKLHTLNCCRGCLYMKIIRFHGYGLFNSCMRFSLNQDVSHYFDVSVSVIRAVCCVNATRVVVIGAPS